MNTHLLARGLLLGLTLALLTGGCGGPEEMPDTAPYQAAITDYLKANSMDLKVNEFEELEVTGETATALVALSAADPSIAQLKVRWHFDFQQADGAWEVTGHQEK